MSLFEEIGGAEAMAAIVPRFYARVLTDPRLAHHFRGREMGRLACHQAAFLTELLGGPRTYRGRDLTEAHRGLKITEAQFNATVEHLSASMISLGVAPHLVADIAVQIRGLQDQVVGGVAPAPTQSR